MSSNAGTKRWDYFNSALRLAMQRSAHKWSYQDFTECFPLWTSENDSAMAVYTQISGYIESACIRELDVLFGEYNVKDNINILHRVITEAKARKAQDETRKDIWRDELEPHAVICARTVPQLEEETRRLKATLSTLEHDNELLLQEIEQVTGEEERNNAKASKLLKDFNSMLQGWTQLPDEEIEEWARKTLEETKPTIRA